MRSPQNLRRSPSTGLGALSLSETDRSYLGFGTHFERQLIHQHGPRSLEASMEVGWRLLATLPKGELARLSDAQIERYLSGRAAAAAAA